MSECEHKYKWDIVNNDAWFYCAHCKQAAGALEIEVALNEHAELKRENKTLLDLIIRADEAGILTYDDDPNLSDDISDALLTQEPE